MTSGASEFPELLTADALHTTPQMGLALIRPYAAVVGLPPSQASGTSGRFGYITEADRSALYRRFPTFAPAGHPERLRADRLARARAAAAQVAASNGPSAITLD